MAKMNCFWIQIKKPFEKLTIKMPNWVKLRNRRAYLIIIIKKYFIFYYTIFITFNPWAIFTKQPNSFLIC